MIINEKYLNAELYEIEKDWSYTPDPPSQDLVNPKIDIRENRDGISLNQDTNDNYYTDDPYIDYIYDLITKNISSLSFISDIIADTDIKGIIIIDNQPKKWNGADWINTTYAYANANSLTDISTNISTLFDGSTEKNYKIRIYLHTADVLKTPTLMTITYTVPDLFSTVAQLRSNLHDVNEHVYSDLMVYNAIVEADKMIEIDLYEYIDFSSMNVAETRIVNKLSQIKTAIIVLERLGKNPKEVKELNTLTRYEKMYEKIIEDIQNGNISLISTSITVDITRQGKAFGFGNEGQKIDFDSLQDEDDYLENYDLYNDA